jgi:hypothetical protein
VIVAAFDPRSRSGAVILAIVALWGGQSLAQSDVPLTDAEVSKETDNPVTLQIALPLRYEAEFQEGPTESTKETLEIDQAVLPLRLSDDWALITRTKLPWVDQPPKKLGEPWDSGLGNGYSTFFLSPQRGEHWYWGAGPVLYYPATNSIVGVNKWGAGPSAAVVKKDGGPWVFGAVVNNIWSFGSPPGSNDRTNKLLLNPFLSYHFDNGWSVGSSPEVTANWIASGGKWTVPVGGGVARVVRLGGQPVKLALDSYYNAVRPKANEETWLLQFTLTFLFPTSGS